MLACSIGKVNAAIGTQILINKYNVDYIINTGIAGGLSPKLKHLSVVISEKLTYHDFDKTLKINWFPNQEYFYADTNLISKAEEAAKRNKLDYYKGVIVTGDKFVSSQELKNNLIEKFDALCVEMEGAAIAHTSYVNDIPFVVIRCISDLADEASNEDYKNFENLAALESSKLVIEMIGMI